MSDDKARLFFLITHHSSLTTHHSSNHFARDRGDDVALFGEVGREGDEDEAAAAGKLQVGGVVAGRARPAGLRPEARARLQRYAREAVRLVVRVVRLAREVALEQLQHPPAP